MWLLRARLLRSFVFPFDSQDVECFGMIISTIQCIFYFFTHLIFFVLWTDWNGWISICLHAMQRETENQGTFIDDLKTQP
jgi:hypothetical protein